MPFTLLQAGTSLQLMDTSGVLTTLTLPTGVTIDSTKPPRFVISNKYAVMVNSPTRPITIDADGVVRVLTPNPPPTPATLSAVAGGTLTGTYTVKYTYVVLDENRKIISESAFSPVSASQAVSSQWLRAASLALASDTVSAIRLYRTLTGPGTVYYQWLDLDGNTLTSVQDDLSDTLIQTLAAAPSLGGAPRLTHIGEFRERLWGASLTDRDAIYYTEASKNWSWPSTNRIPIPREGEDDRGVTAILVRKDALAIAKQNSLLQITGNNNNNFATVKISPDEVGVEADDSIARFRDIIYFVGKDGAYTWGSEGVKSISDGKVQSWFTSDTYFNRSQLRYAQGRIDPSTKKYQILLSAAGSTALDRWIEYDINNGTWWGPHKTDDFTPSWMGTVKDPNTLPLTLMASTAGFTYTEQATRTDGTATGIAMDVDGKFHDMNSPDIEKDFLQLSVHSKIQGAGTLTITPYVGGLNASAGTAISADMTLGREKLRRLGLGKFVKLNFSHSTAAQDIELFGYELPFFERGRR